MDAPPRDEPPPSPPRPLWLQLRDVADESLRVFGWNFLLAYNVRAGIGVTLRALALLRKSPASLLSLQRLLSEEKLTFRIDAVRVGLFIGGVTGLFELVSGVMQALRKRDDGWNDVVAGLVAGMPVGALDAARRRTLALYLFTRLLQCMYNAAKSRGWWHFWGSNWQHGDALLFAISSAQVMYAYVMHPETLPPSYNKFIVATGPIKSNVLQAVRDSCRGLPIDLPGILRYCEQAARKSFTPLSTALPAIVPCSVLHPQQLSCTLHNRDVFLNVFRKIMPLYLTLCFVPLLVLRFSSFLRSPFSMILRALLSATRSTTFLSAFVMLYQLFVCVQRKVVTRDHRLWYYAAGLFSSLSIFIERKSRRAELSLYTLPRAVDSLFQILRKRRLLGSVPCGEVLLFCASLAGVMYFFRREPDTMTPWLRKIFRRFFDEPLPVLPPLPAGRCEGAAGAVGRGRGGTPSAAEVAEGQSAAEVVAVAAGEGGEGW